MLLDKNSIGIFLFMSPCIDVVSGASMPSPGGFLGRGRSITP
jgi:hypothetical protein